MGGFGYELGSVKKNIVTGLLQRVLSFRDGLEAEIKRIGIAQK